MSDSPPLVFPLRARFLLHLNVGSRELNCRSTPSLDLCPSLVVLFQLPPLTDTTPPPSVDFFPPLSLSLPFSDCDLSLEPSCPCLRSAAFMFLPSAPSVCWTQVYFFFPLVLFCFLRRFFFSEVQDPVQCFSFLEPSPSVRLHTSCSLTSPFLPTYLYFPCGSFLK